MAEDRTTKTVRVHERYYKHLVSAAKRRGLTVVQYTERQARRRDESAKAKRETGRATK